MQITKELLVAICAQLLLLTGVHSVPLGTSEGQSEKTQAISEGANHFQDVTTEDCDSQNFEVFEEPLPAEAYLKKIQEQVEAPRTEGEEDLPVRDTRNTSSGMQYVLYQAYYFNCMHSYNMSVEGVTFFFL